MTKDNPFVKKAGKIKLKPFGASKNGTTTEPKTANPFAVVAKKIDRDEYELSKLEVEGKEAMKGYIKALEEASKLFKVVDKISLRGQTHTQKFVDAKHNWDVAERRLDRAYDQMQTISARKQIIRRRRDNGSRTLRSKQSH